MDRYAGEDKHSVAYSTREDTHRLPAPCDWDCPRATDYDTDALDGNACSHRFACDTLRWANLHKQPSRFHGNRYAGRRDRADRQSSQ